MIYLKPSRCRVTEGIFPKKTQLGGNLHQKPESPNAKIMRNDSMKFKLILLSHRVELSTNSTNETIGRRIDSLSEIDNSTEIVGFEHYITTTSLRRDPYYTIYYTNWTRLILIGVLPILLLIYFNYKVSKLTVLQGDCGGQVPWLG